MKAIITTAYGSADVLKLQEIEKPQPKANEVLIKVHVTTVGPADIAFRKGDPFIIKLIYGLRKPKLPIGGAIFSGEVEAVGKDVSKFKPGDEVFGMSPHTFGAHAEYFCLPETETLTIKPPHMSFEEAVGICEALTGLTFLRDTAKLRAGQSILINGASGAVGAYGVQIAKYFGADVTAVCSSKNLEMVRALGADKVIDYTRDDFAKNTSAYDIIFDAVGKRSFSDCKNALKPKGVYLTTVPTFAIVRDFLRTALFSQKKAKFVTAGLMQNVDNLNVLSTLFEGGHLHAVIDRCYSLEQMAEAHRYVESDRKKGNVLITLER